MAAYDLEEQETIDAIRDWWKQHGSSVLLAVAVFVAAAGGIQGWRYYQKSQATQAATLYGELQNALATRDIARTKTLAAQLVERFPGTGYAPRAALIAARANLEAGDAAGARLQLNWVITNGGEEELVDLARLRLAGVLLEEKNPAEALRVLDAKHLPAYDGLFSDLRGDALSAQGKMAEAKAAYRVALDKTDAKSPYRNVIELKLDGLGG